jgi:Protein of unknown function (DUF1566)
MTNTTIEHDHHWRAPAIVLRIVTPLACAALAVGCGTSVKALLAQRNFREASKECGTLSDLRERQACHRQVADTAFGLAEQDRADETGNVDDAIKYYTYALSAYEDAGDGANRERQMSSSLWVARNQVLAGDEVTAERTLQAGHHTDIEIHAAFISICLRHPTSKCIPIAVKHMEMSGNSAADARRQVGNQCIDRLAQGFQLKGPTCAQIEQSLRPLFDATQAIGTCLQYIGGAAELRRWRAAFVQNAINNLRAYTRVRVVAQLVDHASLADLRRVERASSGEVVWPDSKNPVGPLRPYSAGDALIDTMNIMETVERLKGPLLAEADIRLLLAAVELAWAGQQEEAKRALAKAKDIATNPILGSWLESNAKTLLVGGQLVRVVPILGSGLESSTKAQGIGCETLGRAPAVVEPFLNEWTSEAATKIGETADASRPPTLLQSEILQILKEEPQARKEEPEARPTARFVVLAGGLVRDTHTELVWQKQGSSTTMNWANAQTYCSSSGLRLPTVAELVSLVDPAVTSGATINQTVFPGTPLGDFWTSSPYGGSSNIAWCVDFFNGKSEFNSVGISLSVRCVR